MLLHCFKSLIFLLILTTSSALSAQGNLGSVPTPTFPDADENGMNRDRSRNFEAGETTAISVGLLHGGGSLIGFDAEFLMGNTVGFEIGAGFVGFGGGVNFHFKPTVRSSYLTLRYWHQGLPTQDRFVQSLVGPAFVLRAKQIFTASLGFGFRVASGEALPPELENSDLMLTYSIGIYFPTSGR